MNFNTNFLSDFDHIQNIKNFTGIIIGALFLSQFNSTVFDYDNKQIEFYADNSMVNITSLPHLITCLTQTKLSLVSNPLLSF